MYYNKIKVMHITICQLQMPHFKISFLYFDTKNDNGHEQTIIPISYMVHKICFFFEKYCFLFIESAFIFYIQIIIISVEDLEFSAFNDHRRLRC